MEATQKLTSAEEAELDTLLETFPDQDPDSFELAAAAVHRALLGPTEEMPTELAEKLYRTAVALAPAPVQKRRERPTWVTWAGWAVAAGLAGVLAWALWFRPPEVREIVKQPPPPPTPAEERDGLRQKGAAPFVGEKKSVA